MGGNIDHVTDEKIWIAKYNKFLKLKMLKINLIDSKSSNQKTTNPDKIYKYLKKWMLVINKSDGFNTSNVKRQKERKWQNLH
jgi:hypothetical protein